MGFFAKLPLSWVHRCGSGLAWLMMKQKGRLFKVTQRNVLTCFPELSEQEQQQFIADSMRETAKTITEMGPMWWWSTDRLCKTIVKVTGRDVLQRAYDQGRGVIIAAPHLGAWELVGLYCARFFPMTSLYKPPRHAEINEIVLHARERTGSSLVPTDNNGVKALLKALKKGEMIGILPDQEPKNGTGIFAPFMTQPAYTMTLLSRFVKKTQAKVIFSFAQRLENGAGFHLHFIEAGDDIASSDLDTSVATMNKGVERCISHCPTQYQWSYKRFRLQPQDSEQDSA